MISLICFILTLAGSINWFCIGVLQYDFIAGIFGSQANVFSRIIYALIGLSSIWLVFALIKGKGKIKIDGKPSSDKNLIGKKKKQALSMEAAQEVQPSSFNGFNGQTQNYNYQNTNNPPPPHLQQTYQNQQNNNGNNTNSMPNSGQNFQNTSGPSNEN